MDSELLKPLTKTAHSAGQHLELGPFRNRAAMTGPQQQHSGKGKGKGHPITGHEGPEVEQMYSSTLP